ncbi:DedA family protein [Candidatus Peregrinibacteria bacterium CG10_big_fil_rev_8_21_14_0_10_55_24]|nr:MAG: DedA family protein [Candidatus Peregrinibacteria bacterium CG10_big_fil_rev_8_21_14_0_10_55_24]
MFEMLVTWLVDTVGAIGYPGIVFLMALESSFFPFPSEVVMIPAGYLAQQGQMNLLLVIVLGVIGSLLGAWVNYAIAVSVGRKALLTWGKWIFLPPEKFARVEAYFRRHGEIGTLIGRLIPVVRQYISFPAGLVRMNLARFSLFTALGAGIWVTILTLIGYFVGENEALVHAWSQRVLFWVLLACVALVVAYAKLRKR